ncbi:hypothetical protein N7537_008464 [Penicillium hordei]|uniref:LysM domain-containing protein n=1 Tax=Penicillium hordei TaxID=40994 RepID=A0AAD6E0J1_9EURO|nr:uncharacterized protein N7537_008464 [Penicillium hordei]KAJ5598380.1 hypothetical protein N7537_008464 [Penicillium hordei]
MSFVNSLAQYTLFFSLFTLITCFQPFPDDHVGDYKDECADALSTNLTSCIDAVRGLNSNNFYSQHGLDKICTSDCRDQLQDYKKSVASGCSGVTYTNEWGTELPISETADTLQFNFQQTCFKNEGNYCNIVLGNLTKNGGDDCNKCLLLKLRNEAQYPYGSGPGVYSSAYPSYTSSCKFTGYPVTAKPTVSLPHHSASKSLSGISTLSVAATPTASTCSGKKYTIKDGDTCESISKSQSVATYQLLIDNQLQAHCANFPKSGELCIKNHCATYTVQKRDTCKSVAKAHNITPVQLRSYNPWIDGGCYNFNRTIGTELCMNEPGEKYEAPSSAASATGPPTASSAVPVPTNLAKNSTKNCGEYYTPKEKESCDTITQKFPIKRANFLILNPGLNQNCTNFIAGRSYCVKPVEDMDNYPGAPGYMPSVSKVPWDKLPDATYTPINNPDPLPLAPNTVKDCNTLVDGRNLQYNYTGVNDCSVAADFWEVSKADLLRWNPSLNKQKSKSSGCSFSKEYRYCRDGPEENASSSGAVPSTPAPSTPLTTSTSTSTSSSTSSPTPTSTSTSQISTTTDKNTSTDTSSEPTSTTATASATSTSGAAPSPTQTNSIADNCNDYAKAKDGDNCIDFAKDHDITPKQLYQWNTVLGDDGKKCGTMFQRNAYYCISVKE